MRRIALALTTAAIFVASGTGSVGASGGQVTRDWFHGPFAEASWETSAGNSFTDGGVLVSREQNGTTHLTVDLFTPKFDANGNFTGGVDVSGRTTAGVSFTIDTARFTSASVRGVLSMTRCTVDANRDPISCQDAGTLSAAIDWTGQGPIPHQPWTDPSFGSGCLAIDHGAGVERAASATVALGGTAVDPSAMQFAGFGIGNGGVITICPHG